MAKMAEPVRPIIVKKVYEVSHGGHHGGAWKVAYADFVTAMMAFFLLMWLLGATTEKQRKALADYFAPTLVAQKQDSAGGSGFFGGDSIVSADKYPNRAGQTGTRTMTIPRDASGGPKEASGSGQEKAKDTVKFEGVKRSLLNRLNQNKDLRRYTRHVRFTLTDQGLRIDMVDEADFAMFISGTNILTPDAVRLLSQVGAVIKDLPNGLIIRGHTDASLFSTVSGSGAGNISGANNWQLSADRAEMTRMILTRKGIDAKRILRIEGVADREPYIADDKYDPRNRRMSIILGWSGAQ